GMWTYIYDAEGNTTKKSKGASAETWTFGFDHQNHLLWAEDRSTDGGTLLVRADFNYDAFGNLIEKVVDADGAGSNPAVTTRFALDGWKNRVDGMGNPYPVLSNEGSDIWADLNGSNALQTRYLQGDQVNQHFSRTDSGGASWTMQDHLGSVILVTDGSG